MFKSKCTKHFSVESTLTVSYGCRHVEVSTEATQKLTAKATQIPTGNADSQSVQVSVSVASGDFEVAMQIINQSRARRQNQEHACWRTICTALMRSGGEESRQVRIANNKQRPKTITCMVERN